MQNDTRERLWDLSGTANGVSCAHSAAQLLRPERRLWRVRRLRELGYVRLAEHVERIHRYLGDAASSMDETTPSASPSH